MTFSIHLTGVVTDDDGAPVAGATVTVYPYWAVPEPLPVTTSTDASGHYDISFVGNTAATIAVQRDGFERASQSALIVIGAPTITTNVRLRRVIRISAGDSLAVAIPGGSPCGIEEEWICRTIRVAAGAGGTVTLEVTADAPLQPSVGISSNALPSIPNYPCCGITQQVSVQAGAEAIVDVMLPWTSQPGGVTLRTSLQ